jgi:hypothetical protein
MFQSSNQLFFSFFFYKIDHIYNLWVLKAYIIAWVFNRKGYSMYKTLQLLSSVSQKTAIKQVNTNHNIELNATD